MSLSRGYANPMGCDALAWLMTRGRDSCSSFEEELRAVAGQCRPKAVETSMGVPSGLSSGPKTFQGSLDALRHSGTFAGTGPCSAVPDRSTSCNYRKASRSVMRSVPTTSTRLNCCDRIRRSFSTGSWRAGSVSGSVANTEWRTQQQPMPTWKAAGRRASCCWSHDMRLADRGWMATLCDPQVLAIHIYV